MRVGCRDKADRAVLVLEADRPLPPALVEQVAEACKRPPDRLTFIYAPASSLAGTRPQAWPAPRKLPSGPWRWRCIRRMSCTFRSTTSSTASPLRRCPRRRPLSSPAWAAPTTSSSIVAARSSTSADAIGSFRCVRMALWYESQRRLISFREGHAPHRGCAPTSLSRTSRCCAMRTRLHRARRMLRAGLGEHIGQR